MEKKLCDFQLLDDTDTPIAKVLVESEPGEAVVRVRVIEGSAEKASKHDILSLARTPRHPFAGQYRYLQWSGDTISMERLSFFDNDLQENLWIPVNFRSFLYPAKGSMKKGRVPVRFVEMGCESATFYGPLGIQNDKKWEIVLPFTSSAIIATCVIMRWKKIAANKGLYAVQFTDLCDDEDKAIAEAVFALQKKGRMKQ